MKSNKSINEITLFRYLFNLDNRDLPQSIFNWYSNVGSVVDSDRENAEVVFATSYYSIFCEL